ncbi:MAG TPA: isoprenylcysteine carboxylmethyltransferase family protein [Pseudolabrys sp.]|nr:isoprenylcysteine carboxylmethyltransferase family protein [Pseudolabrys sp.]
MSDLHRRLWTQSVLFGLGLAALLFAPAGTFRFWQAWVYVAIFVAATSTIGIYFLKHDPALIERRMAAGPSAEREPAQKIIMTTVLASFVLLMIIPGFDRRWHWSAVPTWLVLVADAGVAVSFVIFFAVMKQNSYAASTVRVEADQPVISTGLYGVVRHPMYAGALLLIGLTPLALGSYRALLVLIPLAPTLAWRLIDEEHYLKRHLRGYADYCRRTPYRLVPWVW